VIGDLLLDPARHPVIGHRGASGDAPENTLESFDLALEHGAEALELDIRLSADGVPMVHHDPTLDRTTDGRGPLASRTADQLDRLDAGARFTTDGATFPWRGRGITIPTLEAVLARYPTVPLLIELKVVEAERPVAEMLLARGAEGRAVVASFLRTALDRFHRPPLLAGASRREIAELAFRAALGLPPRDQGVRLYAVPERYRRLVPVVTRRFVRGAARLGCPVHVWTVNDVATAERLWDRGVAGMITNFPRLIRPARDRRFGGPSTS